MFKKKLNWRTAVILFTALAAITMFSACDPDDPEPSDNGADIKTFIFAGINGTAVIDKDALTVTATANEIVDLASIVATFTLSDGATATVNQVAQVSGVTANNFTTTVIYNVTSSDSRLTNIWKVTIAKGGGSPTMLFGVKQGTITYTHSHRFMSDYTSTFIFDDYGLRTKVVEVHSDYTLITIKDWIAGCNYEYSPDGYPNYDADCFGANPDHYMPTSDHFNEYWWGNFHLIAPNDFNYENVSIGNKTIAGNDCVLVSCTLLYDGSYLETAGWKNIALWSKETYPNDDIEEVRATSVSTSPIPANSFIPYGGSNE